MIRFSASMTHVLGMLLAATSLIGAPAHADETAAGGGSDALEEVIVSARKREERLQDVPISISAFTENTIRDARLENIKDVALRVPNFSIIEAQQPGVALINVRGVGQTRNGEPPVAMVIDGIETSNVYQITQNLFDVERIEVLKGPQGAVYGRNAIGGAILVTTKRPTNDFAGSLQLSGGTGDDWRAGGYLSGPIVEDKLLFRVAASWRDFDGDIDSRNTPGHPKANPDRETDVRLGLFAKLTDAVSADFRYSRFDQTAGAAWYVPVPPGESIDEPRDYVGAIAGKSERKLDDVSFKVDADFAGARLTSVTAYSKIESYIYESLNYTPADGLIGLQTQDTKTWSQELRLSSTGDSPLQWMGGVHYLHTKLPQDTTIFLGIDFFPLFGIPPETPAPLPLSTARVVNKSDAYAAFGQVSYRLPSGWELSGALRYDIDDRSQTDLVAPGAPEFSEKFTSLQPKFDVTWHVTDDFMTYASIGKGFRSGGFNSTALITRVYKKEENWSGELGFKSSFLENRVSLSAAAFHTRVKDRQVYVLDLANSAQSLANPIPKARISGVEFDLLARPVPALDLQLSGGYTDSKITEYDTSVFAGLPVSANNEGNKLPQVPGYSYAASAQYRIGPSDGLNFVPRIEFNGSGGDYYWEIDNVNKRGSIDLVNLRLTMNAGHFSVTGYADNVFDEGYVLEFVPGIWAGSFSGDLAAAAPGRRVGLTVRYDF